MVLLFVAQLPLAAWLLSKAKAPVFPIALGKGGGQSRNKHLLVMIGWLDSKAFDLMEEKKRVLPTSQFMVTRGNINCSVLFFFNLRSHLSPSLLSLLAHLVFFLFHQFLQLFHLFHFG